MGEEEFQDQWREDEEDDHTEPLPAIKDVFATMSVPDDHPKMEVLRNLYELSIEGQDLKL